MDHEMIAPCGMNCTLCINYLAMKYDLNKKGFHRTYCPGCIPRGKHCTHMQKDCDLVGKGFLRFCYECGRYPCKRLLTLDHRYRTKYHMSMVDNLNVLRREGMEYFIEKQEKQWRCPSCGEVICCHNGLCLNCSLEILKSKKTYRWNE